MDDKIYILEDASGSTVVYEKPEPEMIKQLSEVINCKLHIYAKLKTFSKEVKNDKPD